MQKLAQGHYGQYGVLRSALLLSFPVQPQGDKFSPPMSPLVAHQPSSPSLSGKCSLLTINKCSIAVHQAGHEHNPTVLSPPPPPRHQLPPTTTPMSHSRPLSPLPSVAWRGMQTGTLSPPPPSHTNQPTKDLSPVQFCRATPAHGTVVVVSVSRH
eukprot:TRINITY_DN19607_c0_g1_i2.p1 TRINITY_DN19607_c0_g1~~TRINITY_DN19607_c0_g1_i2.p1  ORF type:complete len:155 (-),score=8.25 TRINITY_DN19607_c0_g1_i2:373-837(-)